MRWLLTRRRLLSELDCVTNGRVITLSAGNHGQALAYAAQAFEIPCVVVVREDAPLNKLQAIRRYGAEIVLVPLAEWQRRLEEEQQRRVQLVEEYSNALSMAGMGEKGERYRKLTTKCLGLKEDEVDAQLDSLISVLEEDRMDVHGRDPILIQ